MKQQRKRRPGRPKGKAITLRQNFTVRLMPDHRDRLEKLAAVKGTTPSALIQIAVADLLKKEA